MALQEVLRSAVGQNIRAFCTNGFTRDDVNHCAHFVSHVLKIEHPYNCRQETRGRGHGANLRVNEIFSLCPKVGLWSQADHSRTQLVFATARNNVDLAERRMAPVSQKHVGIYHQGVVYNYHNLQDEVGAEDVEAFRARFQQQYKGDQELFYGWFPGDDLQLMIKTDGVAVSTDRAFEIRRKADKTWVARDVLEDDEFLVGTEVQQSAKGYFGIYSRSDSGPTYQATDYPELEAWALLLEVTGQCESRNAFNCINTYDRARFTFGFYQLAAHTPKDNLIRLSRALARLDDFHAYFPELEMRDGTLHRFDAASGSSTDLEQALPDDQGDRELQHFMRYLNPNRRIVDEQEVLHAARLIHWTTKSQQVRDTQVTVAADILQHKLGDRYARKLPLDGSSAAVCAVVCDIFHQGRSSYADVRPLLSFDDPLDALLHHRDRDFGPRNRRLRDALDACREDLESYVYVAANNEFRRR